MTLPSADALIAEARETAGLTDFGPDSFRDGLDLLLYWVEREGKLNPTGLSMLEATIKRRLVNRLEIEGWIKTHPEVLSQEVGPGVSITGLPRTGTTALANMLSLDDQFRSLRSWEQTKSVPPPVLSEDERDPRRLAAVANYERMARERPEMMALHLFDADTTEEDVELLGIDFKSQQLVLPIFSYHALWRDLDLRPAFAYHKRVIKLLQSRRPPNRWLFKAPAHKFHLEALVSAYPDIRVIMTHRDPGKSIPSAVSFVAANQPPDATYDPLEFGRRHSEHLRIGMENAIAARARLGEDRFFDVHHREFVADPFGVLERLYRFLGQELRPDTLAKMQAWHAKNRSGAHGTHRYTAEQFGLNAEQLRSDFDFYIRRFDVRLEG